MGLFSFIKDAGAKIFGSKKRAEEEAAKKAAADNAAHELAEKKQDEYEERKGSELESLVNVTWGLGIQNLQVEVDNDTATIYGSTDSRANKEKAVLVCGNVEGIATVDDRIEYTPSAERTIQGGSDEESRFYTVQKGDSLSKIAKEMYGDGGKYHQIFEANKPMLKDVNEIYPGQVLRIPA